MRVIDKESVKGKIIYALGIGVGIAIGLSNRRTSYKLTKKLVKKIFNSDVKENIIKRDLYRLRRQKLINIKQVGNKQQILLTEKGYQIYLRFDYENLKLKKKKIWDRKWRMVLFDIPDTKKKMRDAFRYKIKEMGFVRFNQSVWIYPYQCQEEIDFVANYWKIGKYVHFALVSKITNQEILEKHFNI